MSRRKANKPTTLPLPDHLIPAVRAHLALIDQKRIELAALQTSLQSVIGTVVNLQTEQWELDETHLLLTRTT